MSVVFLSHLKEIKYVDRLTDVLRDNTGVELHKNLANYLGYLISHFPEFLSSSFFFLNSIM